MFNQSKIDQIKDRIVDNLHKGVEIRENGNDSAGNSIINVCAELMSAVETIETFTHFPSMN